MGCITCVYLHVHTYEHMHICIKHVLSVETIVDRIQGLNKYTEKVSILRIDYNDEGNYGQGILRMNIPYTLQIVSSSLSLETANGLKSLSSQSIFDSLKFNSS